MIKEYKCISCGKIRRGKYITENKKCRNCVQINMMKKIGWHHSEETKEKIRKALTGKKLSSEHIEKLRKVNLGRKHTDELKKKLSWLNFYRQGGEFRKKAKDGYVNVFKPDHPNANSGNRVFEHRLVMEEKLGRYLEPNELVHHLNGIKDDNRSENLYIVKSNKEHSEKEVKNLVCPHCNQLIENIRI